MWDALSDEKSGLQFSVFFLDITRAAFFMSQSHRTQEHIFIVTIFETPPTWKARFLFLFPPGAG
jgi:hypothetical protein